MISGAFLKDDMDEQNKEELTVAGYIFATHEDAELARNEIKKISYIETKMDMTNMTVVAGIYNKALENNTFQTPIGMEFMHNLYNMLNAAGIADEIKPFPLYATFKRLDMSEKKSMRRTYSTQAQEDAAMRVRLRNSYLISLILAIVIVVLLVITFNGSTMNAINYKAAVTNQYASWEQDLKEREAAVREKERELNINYGE